MVKDYCETTSGGTPKKNVAEYYENGTIPWVKTGELKEKYVFDSEDYITRLAIEKSSAKMIKPDSVLLAMYGATIGRVSILKIPAATNQAVCCISTDDEHILNEFLYYVLLSNRDEIVKSGVGAAQPNISQSFVKEYIIPKPSISEQKKIVEILSKVDEYINEVNNIINDLNQLKDGLLHKLLNDGIGHSTFEKSKLGMLPSEWAVVNVADVCRTTSGGTPKKSISEYYEGGTVPWIRTGKLKSKYINNAEEFITELAVENSSAKVVESGSVLLAMYGATIGRVSILNINATTNQAVCCINCDESKLKNEFLYYYLLYSREKLIEQGVGAAQPNISQTLIRQLDIPLPSLSEQDKIIRILSELDENITSYDEVRNDYQELKKGLMQDLLTGKKRVKI